MGRRPAASRPFARTINWTSPPTARAKPNTGPLLFAGLVGPAGRTLRIVVPEAVINLSRVRFALRLRQRGDEEMRTDSDEAQ